MIKVGLAFNEDAAIMLASTLVALAGSKTHNVNKIFTEAELPVLDEREMQEFTAILINIARIIHAEMGRRTLKN